jgi:TRAP transporter 4TM/12TM fusion protein
VFKAAGGIELIMSVARVIGGRSKAGPAHVAVLSSGFMGMVSGSTVANVASTGSMTIPIMKRFGLRGEHAAAIEAVASTGGQFAPPVMGLTAFLIVGMTGIPYGRIMVAASLSALIYYVYLLLAVNLQITNDRHGGTIEDVEVGSDQPRQQAGHLLREYGHLFLAIGVLVYLLVQQLPPAFAAATSLATIALTEMAKQVWRSRSRPGRGVTAALSTLIRGLHDGVRTGAQLAIVIAAIGIFVDVLVTTGLAQKISYLMLDIASDDLWLLLGMTAVASLLFGLGMPTPAAYILVALLGVPALERVGVPQLAAHMFVFYFANMSAITPPVAVAALVAAKIAAAGYFETAINACRFGLAGFVLPFLFVYTPEILLLQGGWMDGVLASTGALIALIALNLALTGFLYGPLTPLQRLLNAVAAVLILQFQPLLSLLGVLVVAAITAFRYRRHLQLAR